MPSAVANLPTTQRPTRHATLFTEYQEAYQWRGLPEKPVATNDDNDYPQVHVDQAMYN
ncbi:microtubule-associated protein, putative, partial [Leishmania panamensis]